jgi:branched-chain amino acid transport system substrate-binding protein
VWRRAAVTVLVGLITMGGAACGTRLSHREVLVDAQGPLVSVVPTPGLASGGGETPSVMPASVMIGSANRRSPSPGSTTIAVPFGPPRAPAFVQSAGTVNGSAAKGAAGPSNSGDRSPCAPSDNAPISIGSVSELSGPAGASEAQGVTAVQVWASMINDAGGICGHKVQVIAEDDQSDPNKANSEIDDLAENQHVVAFVGEMIGQIGEQIAPTLARTGAPTFGGECGSLAWQDTVGLFTQCLGSRSGAYLVLAIGARYGTASKKVGLLTCLETSLCPTFRKAAEGFAPQLGIQIVDDETISITQIDFTQQCLNMRSRGAAMVVAVMDSASLGRLGVSCSRQAYNPLYVQPSASVSGATITQPGLSNVVVGVPTFPFAGVVGNAGADQFMAAMRNYDAGDQVGPAASFGWTAAKLFERVARIAAAEGPISRQTLYAAAYTLKGDTLGGLVPPLTYTRDEPSADFKCGFYVDGRGGRYSAPIGLRLICAP